MVPLCSSLFKFFSFLSLSWQTRVSLVTQEPQAHPQHTTFHNLLGHNIFNYCHNITSYANSAQHRRKKEEGIDIYVAEFWMVGFLVHGQARKEKIESGVVVFY